MSFNSYIGRHWRGASDVRRRLMGETFHRLFVLCVAGACLLGVGCEKDRESSAIKSEQASYKGWLNSQVPWLTNVPYAVLYDYDFTTLKDSSRTRPVIDYYFKAGNWDGLIDVTFIIDIDAQKKPVRLAQRRVTFIRLPARRVVRAEGGRLRNLYYGVTLWPNDMEPIVERLRRGDRFPDLCTRADSGNEVVCSRFQDTDDWKKLRPK